MSEITCPNCGRAVAKARYCVFCGVELPREDDETIPDEVLEQLKIRKEIEDLTGETAFLRGEIDKLIEQLSKRVENVEAYSSKVKELRERIRMIKGKRKSLEEKVAPLPLEKVAEEREKAEQRIKRLEELREKGEISQETFEKLKREYGEMLERLKGEHYKQVIKTEKWIEQLKRKVKHLKSESELLYARYMAGELPKEDYIKEKEKLDGELKLSTTYVEMLELILKKYS